MKITLIEIIIVIAYGISVLLSLAVTGAIIYVAWHFISKLW